MIKLAKPFITDESIAMAVEVLKSGNLVQSEKVKELESKLCDYLGIKHVILVSSGTAALFCSLKALGVGPGDEVIIPSFTFIATANVVEAVGAKPVLVDISSESFNIDPAKISEVVTPKTKAIIPVHEFGQAALMDKIINIASENNIMIVEDAACSLGTVYKNKKVGNFGKLSCFSFHPRKIITTGEGGMIATNDSELAGWIRSFINHGLELKAGKSDVVRWGLNFRLTDFQAALGIPQLEVLNDYLENRIKLAMYYNSKLDHLSGLITPKSDAHLSHTYQTYHLLLDEAYVRDEIIEKLKTDGIQTNLGAQAIHMLSYYREKYKYTAGDYPIARKAFQYGLSLPIGHHIDNSKIDFIVKSLKKYL